jgi:hypothetical protein
VVERGERGPTGDHGQDGVHGERGEKGDQGDRGLTNKLAIIGYLILAGMVLFAFVRDEWRDEEVAEHRAEFITQINTINRYQCSSLGNLYRVIHKSLRDSDKAIDEIAYYKEHPLERVRAHERNEATLKLFLVPPCPKDIDLPKP